MGWNGSDQCYRPSAGAPVENKKVQKKGGSPIGVIVPVVVLLVVCAGGYWWLLRPSPNAKPRTPAGEGDAVERPAPPVEVTPQPVAKAPSAGAETPETAEPAKEKYLGSEVVSRTATTNKAGFVTERIRTADGKTHRRMHYPKSPFEETTDQYLADVLTQSPDNPRPLPDMKNDKGLDEEFRKSLKTKIVINDDDSPEVKELKARVITGRESMKRLMEETGMSFAEVLADHQRITSENADIRLDAIREMNEIMKKGDKEGARDYIVAMNAAFQQMGIDEIKMPKAIESTEGPNKEDKK